MYSMLDSYEVALKLCGLDPAADENFEGEMEDKVDEILQEKYGITNTEGLDNLIKDLAQLIDVGSSPLSEQTYLGFADKDSRMWLYKIATN